MVTGRAVVLMLRVVVDGVLPEIVTDVDVNVPVAPVGSEEWLTVIAFAYVGTGDSVITKLVLSPAVMVTVLGSALILKSVTVVVPAVNWVNPPPFALNLGVTVKPVVPVVGIRTTVTVAFAPSATIPIWQVTVELTGFRQVPPGVELAEENVKPEDGNNPWNTTLLAGSGPLLSKTNVNVTWLPTAAGFGFTVGGSTSSAKSLRDPTWATNASCEPLSVLWSGGWSGPV